MRNIYRDNDQLLNGLCEENRKHSAWNLAFALVCQAAEQCGWYEDPLAQKDTLAKLFLRFIPGAFWSNSSHTIGFFVPREAQRHCALILKALFKVAVRNLAKDQDVPVKAVVAAIIANQIIANKAASLKVQTGKEGSQCERNLF